MHLTFVFSTFSCTKALNCSRAAFKKKKVNSCAMGVPAMPGTPIQQLVHMHHFKTFVKTQATM